MRDAIDQLTGVAIDVGGIALELWSVTKIRYRIDSEFVPVLLFGITPRKIALSNIESVDTEAPWWNEH